jgi:hypothetical protein
VKSLWFCIQMTACYPVRAMQARLGFPIDMDGYHREFRRAWGKPSEDETNATTKD